MFRRFNKTDKNVCGEKGSLLVEFMIALGLMGIILTSGLDILGPSLKIVTQSKEKEAVASLIQEHFEVIRSIRNENWNALSPEWVDEEGDPLSCPGGESDVWHYEDIDEEQKGLTLLPCIRTFDKYSVQITFHDVYRDDQGNIIPSGDLSQIDDQTRKVTVNVTWQTYGISKSDTQSIYLTNWDAF